MVDRIRRILTGAVNLSGRGDAGDATSHPRTFTDFIFFPSLLLDGSLKYLLA